MLESPSIQEMFECSYFFPDQLTKFIDVLERFQIVKISHSGRRLVPKESYVLDSCIADLWKIAGDGDVILQSKGLIRNPLYFDELPLFQDDIWLYRRDYWSPSEMPKEYQNIPMYLPLVKRDGSPIPPEVTLSYKVHQLRREIEAYSRRLKK